MSSLDLTTKQQGCVAFYYHLRDHGVVSEHFHGAHQISITLGGPLSVRWWSANLGEQSFVAADGNIIVNPAQEPHRGCWDGAWENAGFYVDTTVTDAVAHDIGGAKRAEIMASCQGHDAAVYGMARALLQDVDQDPLSCRLYAESIANVLAVRLLLGHMDERPRAVGAVPALSSNAMRRVECFVAENLELNLSVSDIAAVVSLSAYHFSRRFRVRTGMSPYQYVVRQRVERARQLLRESALPLADIACRTGFSSQSHLSAQFRKIIGISPGRYREEL